GTGSATTGFVAHGNVLTATGAPSTFGYRIEGAISVEISDDVITGPGVASPGAAAVWVRATNQNEDFQLARLVHNTFRNFGALGVTVAGSTTAKLDVLELTANTCDDTAGSMLSCISADADRLHAAKDVRLAGNVLSGGCTTMLATTPPGTSQPWGDR